jgi:TetR/AcrR family transcriptional regulator, copper-responsive repressor
MNAGRQRSFDKEEALNKAMEVFWRNGYGDASLSNLTEAMGINKPSLYATFGNKEDLYIETLRLYMDKHSAPHFYLLAETGIDLEDRLKNFLQSIVKMVMNPDLPGGCLMVFSATQANSDCLPPKALQAIRETIGDAKNKFIDFFSHEQQLGNINKDSSPVVLANYLGVLTTGLTVMAKMKTKQEDLEKAIDHAVISFK